MCGLVKLKEQKHVDDLVICVKSCVVLSTTGLRLSPKSPISAKSPMDKVKIQCMYMNSDRQPEGNSLNLSHGA